MNISSRERKIFLYSLLFLATSVVLAVFANIWFTFNDSSTTFNIFIAGYSVGFLGFSFLCSMVAGKFLAEFRQLGLVVALTIYLVLAVLSNYMFWVLLRLLIKKLPPVLLNLLAYTDGKQFVISALSTLIVILVSALWFFFAKKRRKN